MPEEQTPEESKAEENGSIVPAGMAAWKVALGEVLWKWVAAGGMSIGSLVTLMNTTDLPKVALGGLVGGALSGGGAIATALVSPTLKKTKQGAEAAGEGAARKAEAAAKKVFIDRPFEDQYYEAQAMKCLDIKSVGIPQHNNIYASLLEKVFVDLRLDGKAQIPGYGNSAEICETEDGAALSDRLNIWNLLERSQKRPEFRRFVLQAWGGFGKTTLMQQVTYVYSKNKQRKGLDRKIPVMIVLGRYRELLSGENPPALPEFMDQHYIPKLPGGADLVVPQGWSREKCREGRTLVLLDGLDEVPLKMRSNLASWINAQVNAYPKTMFILSSRPKAWERQQKSVDRLDFSMAFWVEEFDDSQRKAFIDRWYLCQEVASRAGREDAGVRQVADEEAKDLYEQINGRQELKDMAKNPLLLTMMATFHRRFNGASLPKQRVKLYQEICNLQLKDRPGDRERKLETVLLDCDAQAILQPLALEMMRRQCRLLDRKLVLEILKAAIHDQNANVDAEKFLEEVTTVSELLIRQEEEYEFSHLSFQEYLAALEIVKLDQEDLLYAHFNISGEFADSWQRLMLLYVGLVNPTRLIREALKQNKADLADRLYQETTKRIDDPLLIQEIETALKGEVKHSKYSELERLLKAGEWREADEETYRLMITTVGKEEGQGFSSQDLETFPCEDLLTIDRLWVEASNGHFGFSVQKKIWEECGSPMSYNDDYLKFMERVGWRSGGDFVSYNNLRFSTSHSLMGELPKIGMWWKSEMLRFL